MSKSCRVDHIMDERTNTTRHRVSRQKKQKETRLSHLLTMLYVQLRHVGFSGDTRNGREKERETLNERAPECVGL